MLHIETFVVNMIQENCYVLHDETHEAVIIDDGAYYQEEKKSIEDYIENNHLKLVHMLNTNAHLDHEFGNRAIYDRYGLEAEFHQADSDLYKMLSLQAQSIMGVKLDIETTPVSRYLKEGDKVAFGNHTLNIIETPGHTPGGICFYCEDEKVLFSGDSLFWQSIGRTDFPESDGVALIKSLKEKVLTLPEDTSVLTGHGPSTTIGEEKRKNIYFR